VSGVGEERGTGRFRQILQISLPALGAFGAGMATSVADTAIMGRFSVAAVAAVGGGSAVYSIGANIVAASAMGSQIRAAHHIGRGGSEGLWRVLRPGLILTLWVGGASAAVLIVSRAPILRLFVDDAATASDGAVYLLLRSLGLPLLGCTAIFRDALYAEKLARRVLTGTVVISGLNLLLDWLLVYGVGPLPRLGAAGNGLGSLLAVVGGLAVFAYMSRDRLPTWRAGEGRVEGELGEQVKLSWPQAVSASLDYVGIAVLFVLAGRLGMMEFAATRIGFVLVMIVFSASAAMAVGPRVLIGRAWGAEDRSEAERWVSASRALLVLIGLVAGAALLAVGPLLAAGMAADAELQRAVGRVMASVAVTGPLAGLAYAEVAALRAIGGTKMEAVGNITGAWLVMIPLAAWAASTDGADARLVLLAFSGYWIARWAIAFVFRRSSLRRR